MPESPPKLAFRISIRTLLLVTTLVAILFSSYRAAGPVAFAANVIFGSLVGLVFMLLTRRWLGWYSLAIFVGVIIGGVTAVEHAVAHNGELGMELKGRWPEAFVDCGCVTCFGAFVGGLVSIFAASLVLLCRRRKTADDVQSQEIDPPAP